MKIKEVLKSNSFIRDIGKKIKIYNEFRHDADEFSNEYLESAEKSGDHRYRIMLIVHSLEKGMCMKSPRPYGFEKVKQLKAILNSYPEDARESFEYRLGASALQSWVDFFDKNGWNNTDYYLAVKSFLTAIKFDSFNVGYRDFINPIKEENFEAFKNVLLSRHSVRDYKDCDFKQSDIDFAIKCFIEAPTACNRQMCRLIYVKDYNIKELLDDIIIGIPGVNKKTVHYFVVTYDLASFDYSGERQQGLFNAGLCTMNFVNGLHARGIGSCCLQWSNKHSEDKLVREKLGLRQSERIGIVIGAGYYLPNSRIPSSVRRSKNDVYREV